MSTPKGDGFVIGFAAVVCVVCSLLLSATASTLKSKQDFNVELDRKLNVLKAFGVDIKPGGVALPVTAVEDYFKNIISEVVLDGSSGQPIDGMTSGQIEAKELAERKKLPLYVWKENGEALKYAFPVSGKGLWSTIYGYLALEKDLSTVKGVTFYRHGETPAWAVNAKRPGSRTTSRASR
jgi:Na+-transporting NADH:ubiquinone oxidoreductase subunit C